MFDDQSQERLFQVAVLYDRVGCMEDSHLRTTRPYAQPQYGGQIEDILTQDLSRLYFGEKPRAVENVSLAEREC